MRSRRAANARDLKANNALVVRNIIVESGPIARFALAKEAGLTPPTVTGIVTALIEDGIAYELGPGEPSGGRPPILVDIKPDVGLCLAVRLQRGEVVAAIFNLRGVQLSKVRMRLDTSAPEEVSKAIGRAYEQLLAGSGIDSHGVLMAALACPGLVNPDTGVVDRSSNLGWTGTRIGSMVEERVGVPVRLENISNAAALAEQARGTGVGCSNLVYLNMSAGIGAGIVLGGRVHSGSSGYAGEIGHVPMLGCEGAECSCGRQGCLEAVCGSRAVVERLMRVAAEQGLNPGRIDIPGILDGPLGAIPAIRQALDGVAAVTGSAVAILASLFDPDQVVLGGELSAAGGDFVGKVAQSARDHCLSEIAGKLRVCRSEMSEDPPLIGAFLLALEQVLNMENWTRR